MMNMRSSYRAGPSSNINSIHISFSDLLQALYNTLPNKNYILLLYSFLQMHPTFLEVLRTTKMNTTTGVTWAQVVLLRCIQGLYDCCTSPSSSSAVVSAVVASAQLNHIYTTLVCILIIVQDSILLEEIASNPVTLLWYRERPQTTFTVIDAVVLVMLRALTFAVYRVQDSYLLSNICAVFMNILPATRQLHPYTCERLVKTMISYTRRLHRHHLASVPISLADEQMAMPFGLQQVKIESVSSYESAKSDSRTSTQTLDYSYHNDNSSRTRSGSTASMAGGGDINITLLKAALLALLQFTSTIIHRSIKTNVSLLYALILDHETLFSFLSSPDKVSIFLDHLMPADVTAQWQQALHNMSIVLQVTHYYLNRIEASCGERGQRFFSAKEAVAFLQAEIQRMESDPSLIQSQRLDDNEPDEEGGEAMSSQVVSIICGQFPRGQDPTIAKFMYQEADNAADFFIPYIWSNIVSSIDFIFCEYIDYICICSIAAFISGICLETTANNGDL